MNRRTTSARFRTTEAGLIPVDWKIFRLRECLLQNATYGVVKAGNFQQSGVPMLRGGDIKSGRIAQEQPLITESKSSEYSRTILQKNDVVIALVGYPGETAVIPSRLVGANISRAVGLLRLSDKMLPQFLTCYLNSPIGRAAFLKPSAGSAQIVVNLRSLNLLPIPIPPLPEQRAIAEALTDADGLIESLEQLLAKKRDVKQGTMQQLLTGKTRLPGFEGEWIERPFRDCLNRINSNNYQIGTGEYQVSGSFPVIDQGKTKIVGYSNRADRLFTVQDHGVIVFGDHTCLTKMIDFNFIVGADGTQIIESRGDHDIRFYFQMLQHDEVESTGYNRHFKFLAERFFASPPLPEQTAIATVLSDLDAEITALEAKLAKACLIKQGMMQQLLTGRIRLPLPEPV